MEVVCVRTLISLVCLVVVCSGCNFGSGSECAFPCNCAVGDVCDTTTGCTVCGPGWSGPGCLTMDNVALGRPTNQTNTHLSYDSSNAVDGNTKKNYQYDCAMVISKGGQQGALWWQVTFDGVYRLMEIVLYFWPGQAESLQLSLHAQHANGSITDCFSRATFELNDTVYYRISPRKSCIGQSLIIRKHGSHDPFYICEVTVTGQLYNDCGRGCGRSVNDVTSCNEDYGCIENCEAGKNQTSFCKNDCKNAYGRNCQFTCGKCKGNASCDVITGHCPSGCEVLYYGNNCNKFIEYELLYNASLVAVSTSHDSVCLRWFPNEYKPEVQSYYGYQISFYPKPMTSQLKIILVNNTATLQQKQITVTGLKHNTQYVFSVHLFRHQAGKIDLNEEGSAPLEIKTSCRAPDPPQITNYTVIERWNGTIQIGILHYRISENHGCDKYTEAVVHWGRQSDSLNLLADQYTIHLKDKRDNEVRITVKNNEDMSTTSTTWRIDIDSAVTPTNGSTLETIKMMTEGTSSDLSTILWPVIGVAVVIVTVTTVFVTLLLKRKQRNKSTARGKPTATETRARADENIQLNIQL